MPSCLLVRPEARASYPTRRAISCTSVCTSLEGVAAERSWESFACRQGWEDTWALGGREGAMVGEGCTRGIDWRRDAGWTGQSTAYRGTVSAVCRVSGSQARGRDGYLPRTKAVVVRPSTGGRPIKRHLQLQPDFEGAFRVRLPCVDRELTSPPASRAVPLSLDSLSRSLPCPSCPWYRGPVIPFVPLYPVLYYSVAYLCTCINLATRHESSTWSTPPAWTAVPGLCLQSCSTRNLCKGRHLCTAQHSTRPRKRVATTVSQVFMTSPLR